MYVGKSKTKTCLDYVLDIVQVCTNQDLRIVKLQKEKFKICEARLIERKTRPIECCIL